MAQILRGHYGHFSKIAKYPTPYRPIGILNLANINGGNFQQQNALLPQHCLMSSKPQQMHLIKTQIFSVAGGVLKVRYLMLGGVIIGGVTINKIYEEWKSVMSAILVSIKWINGVIYPFKWIYNKLPDFKSIYSALPDFKRIYNLLPDLKSVYNVLPDFKKIYGFWPDFGRIYSVLPDPRRIYGALPDVKRIYYILPGFRQKQPEIETNETENSNTVPPKD